MFILKHCRCRFRILSKKVHLRVRECFDVFSEAVSNSFEPNTTERRTCSCSRWVLIKNKYLPNRFRAEACQVCIRFLPEICFIETLLLTNLGNLAGMRSQTEIEILVSTRPENCSTISDTKVCQQLCPTFHYFLNYFINF